MGPEVHRGRLDTSLLPSSRRALRPLRVPGAAGLDDRRLSRGCWCLVGLLSWGSSQRCPSVDIQRARPLPARRDRPVPRPARCGGCSPVVTGHPVAPWGLRGVPSAPGCHSRRSFRPCRFSRLRRLAPHTRCRSVAPCSRPWGSPGCRLRSDPGPSRRVQAEARHRRAGIEAPPSLEVREVGAQRPLRAWGGACARRGPRSGSRGWVAARRRSRGSEDPPAVAGRGRGRGRSHRLYPCRPSRVTAPRRCFSKSVRSTAPAVSSRALPSGAVTLRSLSLVHSRTASPRPLPSRRFRRPSRPCLRCRQRPPSCPCAPRPQGLAPWPSPLLPARLREADSPMLPWASRSARCATPLPKERGAGARERLTSKSQPVGLVRSGRPSFPVPCEVYARAVPTPRTRDSRHLRWRAVGSWIPNRAATQAQTSPPARAPLPP